MSLITAVALGFIILPVRLPPTSMAAQTSSVFQIIVVSGKLTPYRYSILDLNQDALIHVLEELFAQQCLMQLSMTCQTIREAANHMLFRRCRVKFSGPLAARNFPPDSLWRYIRYADLLVVRYNTDLL